MRSALRSNQNLSEQHCSHTFLSLLREIFQCFDITSPLNSLRYVLLDQGVFVAVLLAHPCQIVLVAMWVRTGSLRPLLTQQPAQVQSTHTTACTTARTTVVLSEQSDKSDITESTTRLIRVCQSVSELAPRLQLLK